MDEIPNSVWQMPQPIIVDTRGAGSRESNLEKLRAILPDPDDLEEFDPVFFRVIASDQSLDSYFTRMSETTIRNYVEDAKSGVSLQQSHNGMRSLGFGRSIDGEVTGTKKNLKAEITFYTVPGIRSGEITSDELIRGIKTGIYRDVSVGFSPDYFECSICGGDPTDWVAQWEGREDACYHMPGFEYQNERGKKEIAWAWVQNARLNEVSFVYDGSNPGASIIAIEKARIFKAQGKLPHQVEALLEQRYRVHIPDLARNWRGAEMQNRSDSATEVILSETDGGSPVLTEQENEAEVVESRGEQAVGEETQTTPVEQEGASGPELNSEEGNVAPMVENAGVDARWASVRAKYEGPDKLFKKMGDDPIAAVDTLAAALVEARQKIQSNARAIKMGEAYEKSLITEAHTEGVRAYGDKYNRDHWDSLFSRMEAEEIEVTIEEWKKMAEARFPGGRLTSDQAERHVEGSSTTDARHIGI